MKHNVKVTLILVTLFVLAQLIGLAVVKFYLTSDLPYNIERPEINETSALFSIFTAILLVTAFALVLLKFRAMNLWKIWFFFGVFFALLISFNSFLTEYLAAIIAVTFAFFKIIRPNIIIHNISELFIYGGLAAIFVPLLNISAVIILLLLISIYDAVAVWKTKHMIKLAKFQSRLKIFTGLLVPYKVSKGSKTTSVAILGGGDIGFPLFFAGVLLKDSGLLQALIAIAGVSLALFLLFIFAKKKKFYPAMPFLTAGALVGYAVGFVV